MSFVFVNPNSTEAMTKTIVAAARAAAPGLHITGRTSYAGPPAIQGAADGEAATPPLLAVVDALGAEGADGVAIGCFDDTGLDVAARRARCPVIGIGQAAFHLAALRSWRFSVVTTLPVSLPVIEGNIARYGLAEHCAKVRASGVPVLALESDPDAALTRIVEEAQRAEAEDGVDCVILGCAGMSALTRRARAALGCPVIDPVEAAARCFRFIA
ncbi:aspartate/glutamate racemase family protein [Salipiger bermudensis]|uniref:aspartate/glutamate racemase family protein n=1 Tax=Salipiger bermudensis TaxID=344736 RepID=UPI001CD4877F|nr:aspartate/glutamate racemase family protein [Salipiger bermudensis]MCA0961561.1 aspartate/glutamate racemase family protein [Salipiger bermudensis]